jgi:hypothetical protein
VQLLKVDLQQELELAMLYHKVVLLLEPE